MYPSRRALRPILASFAALSLLVACSDDDGTVPDAIEVEDAPTTTAATEPAGTQPETEPEEAEPTETAPDQPVPAETTPDQTAPPGTAAPEQAPTDDDPATTILQPRVGTWVVGDAGEVDIDLVDGGLVLLDIRAAEGWNVSIDSEAPDEIEVDFEQGDVEWEIEIQYENGELEIEIDQDIEPAEPGIVSAGEAGEVEFALDGGSLQLVNITEQPGWTAVVTEEVADEIEVEFVNGLAEYVVEIEFDDGVIEVEVDFEVEGPFPT